MNRLLFGMTYLNIVQGYNGKFTHQKHTDYPIDVIGATAGVRDFFNCPCDEMMIKRIYGVGAGGVNTIWLQSTSKVDFANGSCDFATILFTHPDDDDLSQLRVGQCFKRGEKMFREGNDGSAKGFSTGNHLHISVSRGVFTGTGWKENAKGGWDIITSPIKPEDAFFISASCTIVQTEGIIFKPEPIIVPISPPSLPPQMPPSTPIRRSIRIKPIIR